MLSCSVVFNFLQWYGLCPWDSPGKNTRMDCNALLQGISPTQGSNLHLSFLLHWQVDPLLLVLPGKRVAVHKLLIAVVSFVVEHWL